MPNNANKSEVIIERAREILNVAELGLNTLKGVTDLRQKRAGIHNVVVFGRAVTNVLQNLRSTEPTFEQWYSPYVERMKGDEIARYLYELRSRILKQGSMPMALKVDFAGDPMAMMRQFARPDHATSFFVIDQTGGSGWMITLPSGEQEKFYVTLPADGPGYSLDAQMHFADAPPNLRRTPVDEICTQYLTFLRNMVDDARRTFRRP